MAAMNLEEIPSFFRGFVSGVEREHGINTLGCAGGEGKASVQRGRDGLQVAVSWCAVCCHAGWHRAGAPRVTAVNRGCP